MNRELYDNAAGLMGEINQTKSFMHRLKEDIGEIVLYTRWGRDDVRIRPSEQLSNKVCGLIYQELEGRLIELESEFEAL